MTYRHDVTVHIITQAARSAEPSGGGEEQLSWHHAGTIDIKLSGWWFSAVVASFVAPSCSTLSPVSTGMGDRLPVGIPPWYVTKPIRSTQPCIPLGSLNRVPALIGWGKGGNVTSAGWQVTLCDLLWHVSSRRGEACCELLYLVTLLTYFTFLGRAQAINLTIK